MQDVDLVEAIEEICSRDTRYDPEAYLFVHEALEHTVRSLKKPSRGSKRHVSAAELLEGIRSYALSEYGPMALTVLTSWGIRATADFGEIVFNLVDSGRLGKTDEDRREDFADAYDFEEAFARPFRPRTTGAGSRRSLKNRASGSPPRKSAKKNGAPKGGSHGKSKRTE